MTRIWKPLTGYVPVEAIRWPSIDLFVTVDGPLMTKMSQALTNRKLPFSDESIARAWSWFPWLTFLIVSLPLPVTAFILFLTAASTEAAAVYLFFTFLAGAVGGAAALVFLLLLLVYRRRWFQKFRNKVASDGITASEVQWFQSELTTAERKALKQIEARSPLLADAYRETLASRLMASRILTRTKQELLLVERRLNRVTMIQPADTRGLQQELIEDRQKLESARDDVSARFAETQARLQMIEAAASRDLSHNETYSMLQRLSTAQEHLPLSLEMARLEQRALREAEIEVNTDQSPSHEPH